ncbi:hypothetical protein ABV409_01795 [Flagellimonas sp. DF-77]|uniref:hypothetical protein n=1 Tax=Flagellimonas algarum TaxID=3230298 RepID=UPI003391097B
MVTDFANSIELVRFAQNEGLFTSLTDQLSKDFQRANLSFETAEDVGPEAFVARLNARVDGILQTRFSAFQNLVYLIDIPEKTMKDIKGSNRSEMIGQTVLVMLKRTWQKVWIRHLHANKN